MSPTSAELLAQVGLVPATKPDQGAHLDAGAPTRQATWWPDPGLSSGPIGRSMGFYPDGTGFGMPPPPTPPAAALLRFYQQLARGKAIKAEPRRDRKR